MEALLHSAGAQSRDALAGEVVTVVEMIQPFWIARATSAWCNVSFSTPEPCAPLTASRRPLAIQYLLK